MLGNHYFFPLPKEHHCSIFFFGQDVGTMLDVYIIDSASWRKNGLDDLLR